MCGCPLSCQNQGMKSGHTLSSSLLAHCPQNTHLPTILPSPETAPCLLQEMAYRGWKSLQWFLCCWEYAHHSSKIPGSKHERCEPSREQEEWHLRQETSGHFRKNCYPVQRNNFINHKMTESVPLENNHERGILANAFLIWEIKLENPKSTVVKLSLHSPVI